MARYKRFLGIFVIMLLCVSALGNYITASANAKVVPKVVLVQDAKAEYEIGERLYVKVRTPNYNKKVEYRAVIWDGNVKKALNVWTKYPYYYKSWQPTGKTVFPITWIASTPGTYRLTIYVRKVGSKAPYESYVGTKAFVIKAKEEVAKELIIDKDNQVFDGKYSEKQDVIKTNVKLTAKNTILKNAFVDGDVYITGDNALLNNVTVSGKVVVNPGKDGVTSLDKVTAKTVDVLSGGIDSIHVKDLKADEMNAGGENPIRIELDGDTKILSTKVKSNVILVKKSGSFGKITVEKYDKLETKIEFQGEFEEEIVVNTSAYIKAADKAKISKLTISVNDKRDVVKLEGKFASVEVNKEAKVILQPNTVIAVLVVNANFELNVAKTAKVEKVETKSGKVTVTGEGASNVNTGVNLGGGFFGGGGSNPPSAIYVKSVELDTNSAIMRIGQTISVKETIYPLDATIKAVEWVSSNSEVAEVKNGAITAKKVGQAVVSVKTKEGGFTASINVNVTKFNFSTIIRRNNNMVTFEVNSDRNNDVVTLAITDANGNKKSAEQKTLNGNSISFTIPLEKGSYKCCIKGLETDIIEINM